MAVDERSRRNRNLRKPSRLSREPRASNSNFFFYVFDNDTILNLVSKRYAMGIRCIMYDFIDPIGLYKRLKGPRSGRTPRVAPGCSGTAHARGVAMGHTNK